MKTLKMPSPANFYRNMISASRRASIWRTVASLPSDCIKNNDTVRKKQK